MIFFFCILLHLTDDVGKKLTPYASLLVLQTVCHTILMTLLRRMWCQLDQPIDSPLYSYHLRARSCIDIVMRNSVLVTHGRSYVKPNTLKVSFSWYSRMFFICMEKAKGTSFIQKQWSETRIPIIRKLNFYPLKPWFYYLRPQTCTPRLRISLWDTEPAGRSRRRIKFA